DLNVTAGTFTTTDPSKEFVVSATRPKTYISEGNPITVNYTGKGVLSVGGTGQVTIASPITLTKDVDGVAQAVGYDYAGIVNVGIAGNPGGTLTVPGIQLGSVGSNDGMVNFHGGTLVASSDNPDFVHVLSRVWPEGAKIDTNGHDVTMDRAVKAPWGVGVESIAVTDGGAGYIGTPVVSFSGGGGSGATGYAVMEDDGAGGLMVDHIVVTNPGVGYSSAPTVSLLGEGSATSAQIGAVALNVHNASGPFEKLGPGTLTLAAGENLNYTGNTTISEGTLKLIAETMISDSPVIDVLQGAFLDVSGQSCLSLGATVAQTLKGQGVVVGDVVAAAGGSIEPGESPGVLTIDGDLDMSADTAGDGANMTWELAALKDDVDGAPGADFDQLLVLGELTLGGASQLTLDFSLLPTSDRPDAPTLNSFWQISHSWKIIDAGTNPGQTNFTVLAGAEGQFTTSVGTGPGDAGDVYLIYVPEPSGFVLLALGLLGVAAYARRRR
ncbi:MAG: autotransporter-associated beta strand repeat-containing protein, partial [Pirellulales bacterium]|nr:autotransporter-associated beta strand repeat-containing protein [Pirellulales bacterium]